MRTHTVTIPFAIKTKQRHIMLFRNVDTLCWSLRKKKKKGKEVITAKFRILCAQAGGGEVGMGRAGAQGAGSVYAQGFQGAGFVITY